MRSLLARAVAVLFFCISFCAHSVANAEEPKPDTTAQSGVAAPITKDQSKNESAKPDESPKKPSSDPEPECNN